MATRAPAVRQRRPASAEDDVIAVPHVDAQIDTHIRHLYAQYVWALDTADLSALRRLFMPDVVVQDTSGARHDGREAALRYFDDLVRRPVFRGRRHHIDNVVYLACGTTECRVRAYWTVDKWEAESGRKSIETAGYSEDRFVRDEDDAKAGWRFAERLLHYWRDADCPWVDPAATT